MGAANIIHFGDAHLPKGKIVNEHIKDVGRTPPVALPELGQLGVDDPVLRRPCLSMLGLSRM